MSKKIELDKNQDKQDVTTDSDRLERILGSNRGSITAGSFKIGQKDLEPNDEVTKNRISQLKKGGVK